MEDVDVVDNEQVVSLRVNLNHDFNKAKNAEAVQANDTLFM